MGRSFKESREAKLFEAVIKKLPLNNILATIVFFQHTVCVLENAKLSYFQRPDEIVSRTPETTYKTDNIRQGDIKNVPKQNFFVLKLNRLLKISMMELY